MAHTYPPIFDNKKEKKYISVNHETESIEGPYTLSRIQRRGVCDDHQYYLWEPDKLEKVNLKLIIVAEK
jgi:hypothetical protein